MLKNIQVDKHRSSFFCRNTPQYFTRHLWWSLRSCYMITFRLHSNSTLAGSWSPFFITSQGSALLFNQHFESGSSFWRLFLRPLSSDHVSTLLFDDGCYICSFTTFLFPYSDFGWSFRIILDHKSNFLDACYTWYCNLYKIIF